jgi:hypothetical protein
VVVDGQGMRCDDGTPSRARSKLLGLWSFTEERARIDGWEVKHAKIARGVGASLLLTAQDFQSYSHALREFEFQLVGDMQLAFVPAQVPPPRHKSFVQSSGLAENSLRFEMLVQILTTRSRYACIAGRDPRELPALPK